MIDWLRFVILIQTEFRKNRDWLRSAKSQCGERALIDLIRSRSANPLESTIPWLRSAMREDFVSQNAPSVRLDIHRRHSAKRGTAYEFPPHHARKRSFRRAGISRSALSFAGAALASFRKSMPFSSARADFVS
jgi:hypothetical protein